MARYPKGSTNNVSNPNSGIVSSPAGKSGKGAILATSFTTAQNMPEMPFEQKPKEFLGVEDWQPFGSDNLFPQAIAELTRKSPSHRGILNWKTIYVSAKGFSTAEKGDDKLAAYLKSCNAKRETLKKVARKLIFDKFSSGNAYMELVKDKKGSFLNLYHKDHTTCRVSKDGLSIKIHGDWANVIKKEDIKTIPLYPVFAEVDGQLRSIYHFKDYEPNFQYYGVPGWISAMDAAGIAYKTNKWNISRLDNSFAASGTLVVEGNITPKEAKQLKADFTKQMTGEGKQGKIMFIVKALGGGKTEFVPITTTNVEGDWLQLHKQADADLIIAHSWFRSLSGMAEAGQLGNTQQIRNEYQIALSTVIGEEQESFIDIFKHIITTELKLDTSDLVFKNELPISLRDLLDPKAILNKNEQRAIFGYAAIEESITQALNGAQVDALVNILTATANEAIPRDSAINVIINAFGLNKEAAEAMLATIGNGFTPKEIAK